MSRLGKNFTARHNRVVVDETETVTIDRYSARDLMTRRQRAVYVGGVAVAYVALVLLIRCAAHG